MYVMIFNMVYVISTINYFFITYKLWILRFINLFKWMGGWELILRVIIIKKKLKEDNVRVVICKPHFIFPL